MYGDSAVAFAAGVKLRSDGRRVVLISRHTGLLREASWGLLQQASEGCGSVWLGFRALLESRGAWRDGRVDGACAEVLTGLFARQVGMEIRMFSPPCAVDLQGERLRAVQFYCKGRPLWVRADWWVDASPAGELLRMCGGGVSHAGPSAWWHTLFFRHTGPSDVAGATRVEAPLAGFHRLEYGRGMWPGESVLRYCEPTGRPLARLPEMLAHARSFLPLENAIVSHASVVPVAAPSEELLLSPGVRNLVRASISSDDLGGLFDAGECAAQDLSQAADCRTGSAPVEPVREVEESFDVAVAGLGTGGAIAAIAAARGGARVGAFEAMPCVGGVGTSGGIHLYYFGVQGGLQSEVDERIKELMPLFAPRKQVAGFHPFAKICVLNAMLFEAGVRTLNEAALGEVTVRGRGIESCGVLAAGGLRRWKADAWVDATGDGDLAVGAGASWTSSPRSDGVASAFSQASSWISERGGMPYLRIVNFDAGYVDALDASDLTRARLRGLSHYDSEIFTPSHHPSLIAPLLGVRQSRQILAEYMIGLPDLAERTSFPDCIGYTACHLDSHAVDFEFEPAEIAFWIWGCRNWRVRTACEVPYRSLRPKGLKNVLLGCRSIGVTPEAHQSVRMQRDMQRVGEVAGLAAAFAAKFGVPAEEVPTRWLHEQLRLTGALSTTAPEGTDFGHQVGKGDLTATGYDLEALLVATQRDFGPHMYLLARHGKRSIPGLRRLLNDADAAWRAAVVLSMLGDESAEPRLVRAVREREVGFADDDPRHPLRCQRLAPNWLAALVFLRTCGSLESLVAAEELLGGRVPLHNVKTSCGLLVIAVLERHREDMKIRACAARIFQRLAVCSGDNSIGAPQRNVLGVPGFEGDPSIWYPQVVEDFRWQLDLVKARLAVALNEPLPVGWTRHLEDPRAYVRNAFAGLTSGAPGTTASEHPLAGAVHP